MDEKQNVLFVCFFKKKMFLLQCEITFRTIGTSRFLFGGDKRLFIELVIVFDGPCPIISA